jgi:hypothetical protein
MDQGPEWAVARRLREMVKEALLEEGISAPLEAPTLSALHKRDKPRQGISNAGSRELDTARTGTTVDEGRPG